jgi:hypothetical protein
MAEKEVRQKCFVIMPFSKTNDKHTEEYWTKHYEKCIKQFIELTHPLIAERSSPLRGDILRQIITDLVTAPIVVADLTDANPNVYWELGVRQSFKHCTITIAENGTNLPFDLGGKGTLFYFPGDHIKMQDFKNQFDIAIDDCLKNPGIPDSHVLETISGRGTLYQILARDESLRKLDALISESENIIIVLKEAIDTCNKNNKMREEALARGEEPPKVHTRASVRLRIAAMETLVINRYIDADKAFYKTAENCLDWLISVNDQLSDWVNDPETIELWLSKSHEGAKSRIDKFKALLINHKKAIETVS